jgi:hypothetical protein
MSIMLYLFMVLISFANVRDHLSLPVARSVPVERSGTSTERDAGRD